MKTFILVSEKFSGEIEVRYNDDGQLVHYDCRADLTGQQHEWILRYFPARHEAVADFATNIRATITEVKVAITFDMFWKKYFAGRGSDNSSKKRSKAKWDRMSRGEQAKAYGYIHKYLNNIRHGIAVKYAETYLNSDIWNN